jgi:hypothetical protein
MRTDAQNTAPLNHEENRDNGRSVDQNTEWKQAAVSTSHASRNLITVTSGIEQAAALAAHVNVLIIKALAQ